MVYRLRVSDPGDEHMRRFIRGMRAIQGIADQRGFNHIAGFHGAPSWYCWHNQFSSRSPMQARLFLPWHRAYLWHLEQALQDQEPGCAIPWWDWTTDRGVPQAFALKTIDGARNPLFDFMMDVPPHNPPLRERTRRSPQDASWLPTEAEIEAVLEDSDWASFSHILEGHHDRVHGWVGGSMGSITTAAFDPIFHPHHCMIDRLWYLWQIRHASKGVPAALLDIVLDPFNKTVRDVIDVQALGYEYATTSVPVPLEV
jgi:tyrosinase